MENRASVWLITAKANLHVGNENIANAGLIDNAIQRDTLTRLPNINSSSLKGAINEFATQVARISSDDRRIIFGSDKLEKNDKKSQKGAYSFFDANILLLPIQDDQTLYKLVTSDAVLDQFIDRLGTFGIKYDRKLLNEKLTGLGITYQVLEAKEGKSSNERFIDYCSDEELPIIARNYLENGESKNLWYEQVLPRETVFCTIILSDDKKLEEAISDKIIQIGANATIGYGYCKFQKL